MKKLLSYALLITLIFNGLFFVNSMFFGVVKADVNVDVDIDVDAGNDSDVNIDVDVDVNAHDNSDVDVDVDVDVNNDGQGGSSQSTSVPSQILPYELLWTFDNASFGECPPTVGDINGDGKQEIIFGDFRYGYTKSVFCVDEDGNLLWSFNAGGGDNAGVSAWSPEMVDIDNDGSLEIVVVASDRSGSGNNRIIALNGDGTELWCHETSNHGPTAPRIADLNNDGKLEIIGGEAVGAFEDGRVYVLDNNGNELWSRNCGRYVHVNVADLNDDGKVEVVLTSRYDKDYLYVFDGSGQVLWSKSLDSPWGPAVGNINNDDRLEIVVGYNDQPNGGGIRAFDAVGNLLWIFNLEPCRGSPEIADMNNDGIGDVIAVCGFYNVYVLDGTDGSVINSYISGINGYSGASNPVVADLDRDGSPEVIAGNNVGEVYCLNSALAWQWKYFIGDQDLVKEVTAADINDDGILEVLAGRDKLYVLGYGSVANPPEEEPTSNSLVSGVLSGDTTWTQTNSPYVVTAPLLVDKGVILTIEPGVTVYLNDTYMRVNGTLNARGTQTNPIYIICNGSSLGFLGGSIPAIEFTSESTSWNAETNSGSILTNAFVSSTQGSNTIKIANASPMINNCNITNTGGQRAIFVEDGTPIIVFSYIRSEASVGITCTGDINNAVILGNTIYGCMTGIEVYAGSPVIKENNIVDNVGNKISGNGGIRIDWDSTPTIQNNTIARNTVGLNILNNPSPKIEYNKIYDNIEYSIYLYDGSGSNINATYNWWGTTDVDVINQTIRDQKNDFNLGVVSFVPVLTTTNDEPYTEPDPEPEQLDTEPEPEPQANSTQISIGVDGLSEEGSIFSIKGKLTDLNGNPVANKSVTVLYSESGDWTAIGYDTTSITGDYVVQWNSTDYGTFILKAEWIGDENYLGNKATTTFSVLPQQNQTLFYIESNSTVTALEFDGVNPQLTFTVSGPDGTTGYIKATLPKNLLETEENWTVLVDGNPVAPTITEDATKTYIQFTYSHSTHNVKLIGNKTPVDDFPYWLPLPLLFVALVVYILDKKHCGELKCRE